jgi:hypothetical protein
MTSRFVIIACVAAMGVVIQSVLAQDADDGRTLEERVQSLERAIVSLDTRLELRTAPGGARVPAPGELARLEARISQLEQAIDRLGLALDRAERQAESAVREAAQARRDAMNAERIARDASMRVR